MVDEPIDLLPARRRTYSRSFSRMPTAPPFTSKGTRKSGYEWRRGGYEKAARPDRLKGPCRDKGERDENDLSDRSESARLFATPTAVVGHLL